MKKNEIDLRFCIWEFEDISHDDITALMGMEPAYIHTKGQPKNPNFPNYLAKDNGWVIRSSLGVDTSFDDQMNALLDILESKIDILKPLCEKYYCEFACAVHVNEKEESIPSIHLDSRYNKLIKILNIEFDLDLYRLR